MSARRKILPDIPHSFSLQYRTWTRPCRGCLAWALSWMGPLSTQLKGRQESAPNLPVAMRITTHEHQHRHTNIRPSPFLLPLCARVCQWRNDGLCRFFPQLHDLTSIGSLRQVAAVRAPDGHMIGLFEPADGGKDMIGSS
jgi:hypothetical protein